MSERPVHERCWCWQWGRCLTDCPTADYKRPNHLREADLRVAALALMRGDTRGAVPVPEPSEGATDGE